jgi:hypothetical protein
VVVVVAGWALLTIALRLPESAAGVGATDIEMESADTESLAALYSEFWQEAKTRAIKAILKILFTKKRIGGLNA